MWWWMVAKILDSPWFETFLRIDLNTRQCINHIIYKHINIIMHILKTYVGLVLFCWLLYKVRYWYYAMLPIMFVDLLFRKMCFLFIYFLVGKE